jgi:hypothetical protein
MAKQQVIHTNISDSPELLRLAEEVLRTQRTQVLVNEGEALAKVSPARPGKKRPSKRKPIPADDPIWNIIGLVSTEGPDDVGENKRKHLAEAHYAEI